MADPRRLRITLVEFSPSGGLFQFAYQLGLALADQGHDVSLLTGPAPEFPSAPGLAVVPALSTWHPHAGAESSPAARKLRRAARAARLLLAWAQTILHLRTRQPDLVLWAEWRFPVDAWAARLARRLVPRAVMMDVAHTPRPFSEQRTAGSLYKQSRLLGAALSRAYASMDAVVVLGERAAEDLRAAFPDVQAIRVIEHGDEGLLASTPVSAPSAAPVQALFFGTLARYKGLPALLGAWRQVRRLLPDARLVIAGATVDVDVEELRDLAAAAGGVKLRFGYVTASEVAELFERARLVVAPYAIANASGVVKLAHGFARPVVVTDVGDLAAAVDHEVTGLVVAAGDEAALAAALGRLLEQPEMCDRLGRAGQAQLARTSTWARAAERVLETEREQRKAAPGRGAASGLRPPG